MWRRRSPTHCKIKMVLAPAVAARDVLLLLAAVAAFYSASGAVAVAPSCPAGTTFVDSFALNGSLWAACEDLSTGDGALVLVSDTGEVEWFAKGYAPYVPKPDSWHSACDAVRLASEHPPPPSLLLLPAAPAAPACLLLASACVCVLPAPAGCHHLEGITTI